MAWQALSTLSADMVADAERRRTLGDQIPFLRCAVCGHHVTGWSVTENNRLEGWEVTVECHGATEEAFIPRMMMAEGWELKEALCFATPALEARDE